MLVTLTIEPAELLGRIYEKRNFPILADFESAGELGRWSGSARFFRSNQQAIRGSYALRVDMGTEQYSGVSLNYFEGDWRGFNTLSIDVFNAESIGPVARKNI